MILLDTCAIIWEALNPSELSQKAATAIHTANDQKTLMMSDISIWEISMLIKKQRLQVNTSAAHFIKLFIQSKNIRIQPITPEIAELSVNFGAEINQDPADRIIAATAIICNAQLVTADQNLIASKLVNTIW